jgi:hypothetical protein
MYVKCFSIKNLYTVWFALKCMFVVAVKQLLRSLFSLRFGCVRRLRFLGLAIPYAYTTFLLVAVCFLRFSGVGWCFCAIFK